MTVNLIHSIVNRFSFDENYKTPIKFVEFWFKLISSYHYEIITLKITLKI